MSRRHTLPDPRRLPHSGASRKAVRKTYVEARVPAATVLGRFLPDGTLDEADGVDPDKVLAVFSGRAVYQLGANRRARRHLARETRFRTDGTPHREPVTKAAILSAMRALVKDAPDPLLTENDSVDA